MARVMISLTCSHALAYLVGQDTLVTMVRIAFSKVFSLLKLCNRAFIGVMKYVRTRSHQMNMNVDMENEMSTCRSRLRFSYTGNQIGTGRVRF